MGCPLTGSRLLMEPCKYDKGISLRIGGGNSLAELGKCAVLALLKESEGNHYGDHDGYERDTLLPSIGFDKDADYDGKGDDAD